METFKGKTLVTQTNGNSIKDKFCEYCKKTNHYIGDCYAIMKISLSNRIDFIKKSQLCFSCLQKNHFSRNCKHPFKCFKCTLNHPTILHSEFDRTSTAKYPRTNSLPSPTSTDKKPKGYCPILPVVVRAVDSDDEFIINCALDTCSTDCWMTERLLQKLKIDSSESSVNLSTMGSTNKETKIRVVNNLIVSDLENTFTTKIPVVYTKPNAYWPFSKNDVTKISDVAKFPCLNDIPFNYLDENVDLLIGMNMPQLLKPLEVVDAENVDCFATRHHLGWVLNGTTTRSGIL